MAAIRFLKLFSSVVAWCVSCTKVKVSVVPRRHVAVDSVKSLLTICFFERRNYPHEKCVYNQQRSRTLSINNFERRWFSNRYVRANMSSRSRPSNVRVTGAKRAQRGTQFSIEVSWRVPWFAHSNERDDNDYDPSHTHTKAPLSSLFFFSRATRRVHDEKHLLARRVHQSLSAGDDSVPAAVARRRASAKVRPHWVKAKAAWWGSRLARQSMRAVVVPPTGARYLSMFPSFSDCYVYPAHTHTGAAYTSARFTFRSRRGGLRIILDMRVCVYRGIYVWYYRVSTYLSNLWTNLNEIILYKLKIDFFTEFKFHHKGKVDWTIWKETLETRKLVELT